MGCAAVALATDTHMHTQVHTRTHTDFEQKRKKSYLVLSFEKFVVERSTETASPSQVHTHAENPLHLCHTTKDRGETNHFNIFNIYKSLEIDDIYDTTFYIDL